MKKPEWPLRSNANYFFKSFSKTKYVVWRYSSLFYLALTMYVTSYSTWMDPPGKNDKDDKYYINLKTATQTTRIYITRDR